MRSKTFLETFIQVLVIESVMNRSLRSIRETWQRSRKLPKQNLLLTIIVNPTLLKVARSMIQLAL